MLLGKEAKDKRVGVIFLKRLDEIDTNFRVNTQDVPGDYVYRDPREAPFKIYGLCPNDEGTYCRLPLDFLPECTENVQRLAYHLTGACVRFTTDSSGLHVLWELDHLSNMPHFTGCGQNGMELFEETEQGTRQISNLIPRPMTAEDRTQSHFIKLPGGLRHYVLYLPLYNGLTQFLLGFAPDAKVEAGRTPRIEKPILFYGSSITQGGCASKAGSCYTTLLARRLDAALVNLGFSGNGRAEENMARHIASREMSLFAMDYDHNAPNPEFLQATHERMYRIVREAQPELPIVLISRPDFDKNYEDSTLRRDIILDTYHKAVAEGDKNVYFVDGERFFGSRDRDLCTVDGVHPTDIGFLRMADTLEFLFHRILYK